MLPTPELTDGTAGHLPMIYTYFWNSTHFCYDNPRQQTSTSFKQLYQIPNGHWRSPELDVLSQYCVINSLLHTFVLTLYCM